MLGVLVKEGTHHHQEEEEDEAPPPEEGVMERTTTHKGREKALVLSPAPEGTYNFFFGSEIEKMKERTRKSSLFFHKNDSGKD